MKYKVLLWFQSSYFSPCKSLGKYSFLTLLNIHECDLVSKATRFFRVIVLDVFPEPLELVRLLGSDKAGHKGQF